MSIGSTKAAVGASGLSASGFSRRHSARECDAGCACCRDHPGTGRDHRAGYTEQARSYAVMHAAAETAATGETAIAGQQQQVATSQWLASATEAAGQQAATGDFVAAALKGAGAVASLFTGGIGAAIGGDGGFTPTAPVECKRAKRLSTLIRTASSSAAGPSGHLLKC